MSQLPSSRTELVMMDWLWENSSEGYSKERKDLDSFRLEKSASGK